MTESVRDSHSAPRSSSTGWQTRNTIIELLSQFGESREAREYLRRFNSLDRYQFAIVKVGGEVLRSQLDSLATALCFLHHVGLFPIVLHGAGTQLNEALQAAGIQTNKIDGLRVTTPEVMAVARPVVYQQNAQLAEALEARGARTRSVQHGVFQCEFEDQARLGLVGKVVQVHLDSIKSAIRSGALPLVSCLGESSSGQVLNVNADSAARALVLAIQPHKVIFLTPTGGLLDGSDQIISAINLETDYSRLLQEPWLHSGMRLKLQQIKQLLDDLPLTASVSITSAEHLTRELFTYRGAGTLVKRGERFDQIDALSEADQAALTQLLCQCFQRQVNENYFHTLPLDCVIWPESRRAAAILTRGVDQLLYLDKFAVTPDAQGEGLGVALWEQVLAKAPRLYWRSRHDNPINGWYFRNADLSMRRGEWTIFCRGIEDLQQISRCCDHASAVPGSWVEDQ